MINKQQRYTAVGCGLIAFALFLLGLVALFLEGHAGAVGGQSSISELFWITWANQPWIIFLVGVLCAFTIGFFCGHFVAQQSSTYVKFRDPEGNAVQPQQKEKS